MRWMTTYPTPDLQAAASEAGTPGGSSLISREKLFGNPTRIGAKASPDGHWLSWIAPVDGVLNLWVAPRQRPDEAQALTHEQTRPIRSYFWSPDSRQLLYVNDQGGDENFRLFAVEATGGEPRLLTPQDDIRVMVIGISPDVTDHLLIGLNDRDPRWHDVYRLYLADGRLEKVLENEGYGGGLPIKRGPTGIQPQRQPGSSNFKPGLLHHPRITCLDQGMEISQKIKGFH